jgi:hypothetical protein
MNRFEDELSDALRRKEAPAGFAARVIARAAAPPPQRWAWFRAPGFRWAVAAACCLMLLAGLEVRRQRDVRARGEAARAQLMLAVRIAGAKLHVAQMKVHEAGERRVRLPEKSL